MKVRIEQSQKNYELSQGVFDRMRGKAAPTHTSYSVDLKIELTNEEKAIIHQYNLNDLIVEEIPNPRIAQIAQEYEASNSRSTHERLAREMNLCQEIGPLQYKLADFISEKGFSRGNDTLREATDYAHKLKTDILPKIKNIIEHYSATGGQSSDTFEL